MWNSSSSLTRNIASHSKENLAFHSLLRWKMIFILQILPTSLIHFLFKRPGDVLSSGVKELNHPGCCISPHTTCAACSTKMLSLAFHREGRWCLCFITNGGISCCNLLLGNTSSVEMYTAPWCEEFNWSRLTYGQQYHHNLWLYWIPSSYIYTLWSPILGLRWSHQDIFIGYGSL